MHQISIDPQNVTEKLLKSAKFKKKKSIPEKRASPHPLPFFFKVLSNSLPRVQGHSFRNANSFQTLSSHPCSIVINSS